MEEFEANPMRGTSFDIDDDEEEDLYYRIRQQSDIKSKEEIYDMIEQITQRLKYYQNLYQRAKRKNDRTNMVVALRNYKALEGASQALRWALNDPLAEIVLY